MNSTNENKSGKMEHSKEPWIVNGRSTIFGGYMSEELLASCSKTGNPSQDISNAARIVACVNFCKGVDLSLIPDGGLKTLLAVTQSLGGDAAELTSLRSQLAAAQAEKENAWGILKDLTGDVFTAFNDPAKSNEGYSQIIERIKSTLSAAQKKAEWVDRYAGYIDSLHFCAPVPISFEIERAKSELRALLASEGKE